RKPPGEAASLRRPFPRSSQPCAARSGPQIARSHRSIDRRSDRPAALSRLGCSCHKRPWRAPQKVAQDREGPQSPQYQMGIPPDPAESDPATAILLVSYRISQQSRQRSGLLLLNLITHTSCTSTEKLQNAAMPIAEPKTTTDWSTAQRHLAKS